MLLYVYSSRSEHSVLSLADLAEVLSRSDISGATICSSLLIAAAPDRSRCTRSEGPKGPALPSSAQRKCCTRHEWPTW